MELVAEHKDEHGLTRCLDALGLARSTWYYRRHRPEPSERDSEPQFIDFTFSLSTGQLERAIFSGENSIDSVNDLENDVLAGVYRVVLGELHRLDLGIPPALVAAASDNDTDTRATQGC